MGRVIVGSILSAIAVALIGLAILSLVGKIADNSKLEESNSWPSVAGFVTASEIVQTDANEVVAAKFGRGYLPEVSYRYNVRDRDYESGRITFSKGPPTVKRAEEAVERYPVGQEVEVFYDPANPAQAMLERSEVPGLVLEGLIFSAIGGLLFGVIGVGFFLEARKHRDRGYV